MQHITMQHITIQHTDMQHTAIQYITMQHPLPYDILPCSLYYHTTHYHAKLCHTTHTAMQHMSPCYTHCHTTHTAMPHTGVPPDIHSRTIIHKLSALTPHTHTSKPPVSRLYITRSRATGALSPFSWALRPHSLRRVWMNASQLVPRGRWLREQLLPPPTHYSTHTTTTDIIGTHRLNKKHPAYPHPPLQINDLQTELDEEHTLMWVEKKERKNRT